MRILAFDTATGSTAVALCDSVSGLELEARDDPPHGERPRHTTKLMPLIVDVLARTATDWVAIDRIAVGVGPGTFTGLRIGIATARALGQARGIPLAGVSSLHSLALNLARTSEPNAPDPPLVDAVLAVLDARRGEVFAAGWRVGGSRALAESLLEPCALAPGGLAALLPDLGSGTLAIGAGAVEFRSILERSGALIPEDESELHRVTAINHCQLALRAPASARGDIRPEYLRLPDAEIARRAARHQ